ncbi:hypothetical protein MBANPS3_005409 [Mucor bainieri]
MHHMKMHSTLFGKFKLHTVHESAIFKDEKSIFGEYIHVEKYIHEALKGVKTWSKPCYLWLAVSSANKKIYLEIIPGNCNTKLIRNKTSDSRNKDSFVLHLNCFSIKSFEINIDESYLSLDERVILLLHSILVSQQDDIQSEDDEDDAIAALRSHLLDIVQQELMEQDEEE